MLSIAYFSAIVLIGILFLALALHAARHASVPGAKALVVITLAAAGYAIAFIFQISSPDLSRALFWYNLSLPAANILAPAWLMFALAWSGRDWQPNKRQILLLGVIPLLVCLAGWSNPLHKQYGTNFQFVHQDPWAVLAWTYGFWYWIGFCYAYIIIAGSILILVQAARRGLRLYANLTLLLLAGAIAPGLLNIFYNAGFMPVTKLDLAPFAFLITGLIWSLVFFRYRLFNIAPMARELVFKNMPIGMLVLDALERVVEINPAGREMLGLMGVPLTGKPLPDGLPDFFSSAKLREETEEKRETIWLKTGEEGRCLEITLRPFLDREKNVTGSLLLMSDVTSRARVEESLRESESKLRALFAAMDDIIIIYDVEGGYREIAPTNPALLIRPADELLGKTVNEVFSPELARTFLDGIEKTLADGKAGGLEYSLEIGQKEVWFSANLTALSPSTVLWVARDITARKQVERDILESEARLRQAQSIAHLGSWEVNLATSEVTASEEALKIYGIEVATGQTVTFPQIQAQALPEQREHLDLAYYGLLQGGGTYDEEFRIRRPGEESSRVVHVIANLENASLGEPGRVVGVIQDITERNMAEKEMKKIEKRYRSVVQSAIDAIVTADAQGHMVSWNQGAQKIFQYTETEVMGKPLTLLMPENYQEAHTAGMAYMGKGGAPRFLGQILKMDGKRKNGQEFPMEMVLSTWNEDENMYFTGIIRDITDRQEMENALLYQSTHDALTGLFNRQYYETEIDRLQQGRHYPVSILMMDVDGLKFVNDNLGHPAGDELLRQVAAVLKATFRPEDMIARIGGDEFVVILPDADNQTARVAVVRLKDKLDRYNRAHPEEKHLSLSIGLATGSKESKLSEVFKHADRAMYREKGERKESWK